LALERRADDRARAEQLELCGRKVGSPADPAAGEAQSNSLAVPVHLRAAAPGKGSLESSEVAVDPECPPTFRGRKGAEMAVPAEARVLAQSKHRLQHEIHPLEPIKLRRALSAGWPARAAPGRGCPPGPRKQPVISGA
jgi:hypothetical protein